MLRHVTSCRHLDFDFFSVREYQDIANLQLMIQQKQQVSQDKWDVEQKEYVEGF